MLCPLCGIRKARRFCPGVEQQICAVCCGTKRLVEIRCPPTCPYLATAREHPPAVVRRERERDAAAIVATMTPLTERQQQMFVLAAIRIHKHEDDPLRPLLDADVAEAASALAATLETSARGVIYEHPVTSLPAQRVLAELKSVLDEVAEHLGARQVERDMIEVLRAVERGARAAHAGLPGGERAFRELLSRSFRDAAEAARDDAGRPPGPGPALILPPD